MSAPLAALLLLAQFLDPNQGPEQHGDFRVNPHLFFAMFGLGFLIAVFGHIIRSRTLVVIGITLVFVSTVLIPIALQATG